MNATTTTTARQKKTTDEMTTMMMQKDADETEHLPDLCSADSEGESSSSASSASLPTTKRVPQHYITAHDRTTQPKTAGAATVASQQEQQQRRRGKQQPSQKRSAPSSGTMATKTMTKITKKRQNGKDRDIQTKHQQQQQQQQQQLQQPGGGITPIDDVTATHAANHSPTRKPLHDFIATASGADLPLPTETLAIQSPIGKSSSRTGKSEESEHTQLTSNTTNIVKPSSQKPQSRDAHNDKRARPTTSSKSKASANAMIGRSNSTIGISPSSLSRKALASPVLRRSSCRSAPITPPVDVYATPRQRYRKRVSSTSNGAAKQQKDAPSPLVSPTIGNRVRQWRQEMELSLSSSSALLLSPPTTPANTRGETSGKPNAASRRKHGSSKLSVPSSTSDAANTSSRRRSPRRSRERQHRSSKSSGRGSSSHAAATATATATTTTRRHAHSKSPIRPRRSHHDQPEFRRSSSTSKLLHPDDIRMSKLQHKHHDDDDGAHRRRHRRRSNSSSRVADAPDSSAAARSSRQSRRRRSSKEKEQRIPSKSPVSARRQSQNMHHPSKQTKRRSSNHKPKRPSSSKNKPNVDKPATKTKSPSLRNGDPPQPDTEKQQEQQQPKTEQKQQQTQKPQQQQKPDQKPEQKRQQKLTQKGPQRHSCPVIPPCVNSRSLSPQRSEQRLASSFSALNHRGRSLPRSQDSVFQHERTLSKSASFLDAISIFKQRSPIGDSGDDNTSISFQSYSARGRSPSGYLARRSTTKKMEIKAKSQTEFKFPNLDDNSIRRVFMPGPHSPIRRTKSLGATNLASKMMPALPIDKGSTSSNTWKSIQPTLSMSSHASSDTNIFKKESQTLQRNNANISKSIANEDKSVVSSKTTSRKGKTKKTRAASSSSVRNDQNDQGRGRRRKKSRSKESKRSSKKCHGDKTKTKTKSKNSRRKSSRSSSNGRSRSTVATSRSTSIETNVTVKVRSKASKAEEDDNKMTRRKRSKDRSSSRASSNSSKRSSTRNRSTSSSKSRGHRSRSSESDKKSRKRSVTASSSPHAVATTHTRNTGSNVSANANRTTNNNTRSRTKYGRTAPSHSNSERLVRSASPSGRSSRVSYSERNARSESPSKRRDRMALHDESFGSQVSFAIDEYTPSGRTKARLAGQSGIERPPLVSSSLVSSPTTPTSTRTSRSRSASTPNGPSRDAVTNKAQHNRGNPVSPDTSNSSDTSTTNPILARVRQWNKRHVLPKDKLYCRGVIEYANQKFHISSTSLALSTASTASTAASTKPPSYYSRRSSATASTTTMSTPSLMKKPFTTSTQRGTRSLDNCHASSATDCLVFAAMRANYLDEPDYGEEYMEEARFRHDVTKKHHHQSSPGGTTTNHLLRF